MVKGKTKTLFYIALVKQSSRLIIILISIPFGVLAIASANIITSVLFSMLYIGYGMYYLGYTFKEFFVDILKTVVSGFVLAAVLILSLFLFKFFNVYLAFLLQALISVITYILISKVTKNPYYNEFFDAIKLSLVSIKNRL